MPIFRLGKDKARFPDPSLAEPSGVLGVGGDLSVERLLAAYMQGIFPWYEEGQPILWWSPDPRTILSSHRLHVPRSLEKTLRADRYQIRFDTAFSQVMRACAETPRPGQNGTWITDDMIAAYERLHERGLAHSAEAWRGDVLLGGLYGVSLGGAFFGESMFAREPDASKAAFVLLVRKMAAWGIDLVDCQVKTAHLSRFGAYEVPRAEYLRQLSKALDHPTRKGSWTEPSV